MTWQPRLALQQMLDAAAASLQAGQLDQASMAVREALLHAPQDGRARLLEASIALARNQPEAALVALDAHDLNNPDSVQCPERDFLRSQALCRIGQTQMALDLLEKLASQYPDDLRAHQSIASIHLAQGNQLQAIVHLRHVLRLSPSDQTSLRQLVDLLAANAPVDCVALLESMLPTTSDVPAVMLQLAQLYHALERDRDAEEMYRQLLTHQPDDARLWLAAGQLADQMGAMELAIQRLNRAVNLAGRNQAPMLRALALVHMRGGRLPVAGRLWWQLYRQGQSDYQVESAAGLLVCALALGRKKIIRAAHHQLATHASREERRKAVMHLWARTAGGMVVAQQLGMTPRITPAVVGTLLGPIISRARDTLKAHVASHLDRADGHYHLARCQHASGETDDAWRSVNRALEINPRYITAARLYAQLEVDRPEEMAA